MNLMKLPDMDFASTSVVKKEYLLNAILSNFRLVDSSRNCSQLPFLETFYIKTSASKINDGSKASRDFVLLK